jgi:hypothetical protein
MSASPCKSRRRGGRKRSSPLSRPSEQTASDSQDDLFPFPLSLSLPHSLSLSRVSSTCSFQSAARPGSSMPAQRPRNGKQRPPPTPADSADGQGIATPPAGLRSVLLCRLQQCSLTASAGSPLAAGARGQGLDSDERSAQGGQRAPEFLHRGQGSGHGSNSTPPGTPLPCIPCRESRPGGRSKKLCLYAFLRSLLRGLTHHSRAKTLDRCA